MQAAVVGAEEYRHRIPLPTAGFPYTAIIVAELTAEGLVCVEWNGKKISVHGHEDPR
jgi:hypothetical protein